MAVRVRIVSDAPRRLSFTLELAPGQAELHGALFPTICKLEQSLATLKDIARSPERLIHEPEANVFEISSTHRRATIKLTGRVGEETVKRILDQLGDATVADERSSSRRRTDLTGKLCDLEH